MASSHNLEFEAAMFLQKLIQDFKDEPAKMATNLYVILQHMKSSGKEHSMSYQVISRAMEVLINQHGLDIEALKSSRLPLTSGAPIGSSLAVGVAKDSRVGLAENETSKTDLFASSRPPVVPSGVAPDYYQGSVAQRSGQSLDHESPSTLDSKSANLQTKDRRDTANWGKQLSQEDSKKATTKRKCGDPSLPMEPQTDIPSQPDPHSTVVSARKGKMIRDEASHGLPEMPKTKRPRVLATNKASSSQFDSTIRHTSLGPPQLARSYPTFSQLTQLSQPPQPIQPTPQLTQPAGHIQPPPEEDDPHLDEMEMEKKEMDVVAQASNTNANKSVQRNGWIVNVIDDNGEIKEKKLRFCEVWNLDKEKVVVEFDRWTRPIGDAAGLFSRCMGRLVRTEIPINFENWLAIPESTKNDLLDRMVMPYFYFKNDDVARGYTKKLLGTRWRNYRVGLYNNYYKSNLTKEQNIEQNRPKGVTREEWKDYLNLRDSPEQKEMSSKNKSKRKKKISETLGSKTLARKQHEMEKETGKLVGRAQLWVVAHKGRNGLYINERARVIGEKLEKILEEEGPSQHSIVSANDAIGKVFGKEHPGRVRGMGMGVCPTSAFKLSTQTYGGTCSNSSSATQEKVQNLKSELDLTKEKLHRIEDDLAQMKSELLETRSQLRSLMDSFNAKERSQPTCLGNNSTANYQDIPREPFVPLTKEEEAEVTNAFSDSGEKVLVSHENSNIDVTVQIFQCLQPHAALNDEVIDVYLELLKEREKREPDRFLRCHFFNTFFYQKLISGKSGYDFKSVRRWTSKLGYCLLKCDKIFVPIHKRNHWCLAIINKRDHKFQYLDSLGGTEDKILKVLARYFVDEVKEKSKVVIDVNSWKQEFVEDLPKQENGFDCGMFMLKYIDFHTRGLGLCFKQGDMPYFRLRTAKEILRLKAD